MFNVALVWLLLTGCAMAATRDVQDETDRLLRQGKTELTTTERDQLVDRGWRDRRLGEYDPPVARTSRPSDYTNDVHRGEVEYNPTWHNYTYHTVRIPDGTVIDGTLRGYNFSQIAPATEAIVREPGFGHDLTFIRCNLVNVATFADWTIQDSNTSQHDRVGGFDRDGVVEVTDSVFVGRTSNDVDLQRTKPQDVLE